MDENLSNGRRPHRILSPVHLFLGIHLGFDDGGAFGTLLGIRTLYLTCRFPLALRAIRVVVGMDRGCYRLDDYRHPKLGPHSMVCRLCIAWARRRETAVYRSR